MEKLVYIRKTDKIAFGILLCLFIVSYFEYFFRGGLPIWILLFIFSLFSLKKYRGDLQNRNNNIIYTYFIVNFFVCILQSVSQSSVSSVFAIGQVVLLSGYLMLGVATKETLFEKFVVLTTIIASYSIVIFVICSLFPLIKDYLVNVVCPNYPSLGVEKALQEGGGTNFVIYNFQIVSEYAILTRNCGPFWEPGMFAVFLDLALFINLFLIRGKKFVTVILTIALLTTLSTGGYIGGMFIISSFFFLERKHVVLSLLSVVLFIVLSYLFFTYDYMGDKLIHQMTDYQIGSDDSRFGALFTHWIIFTEHYLWGYIGIEGYTVDGAMSMASGLLVPLSSRGIFGGVLYYIMLYKASVNYSLYYTQKKEVGIFLFVLILLLSLSQTILFSSLIFVFIFAGLTLKVNQNRNNNTSYATV